jgi:hypothetical protein
MLFSKVSSWRRAISTAAKLSSSLRAVLSRAAATCATSSEAGSAMRAVRSPAATRSAKVTMRRSRRAMECAIPAASRVAISSARPEAESRCRRTCQVISWIEERG